MGKATSANAIGRQTNSAGDFGALKEKKNSETALYEKQMCSELIERDPRR